MPLTVLIAGGGRIGSALAGLLSADRHRVIVVEERADRVETIQAQSVDATVIHGDATDPVVLQTAGIRASDVVATVTDGDAANLLIASLARFEFGVPRTIARIIDPACAWLFTESMGVDVPLNQAQLLAQLVAEEMSLGEMTTLAKLRRGRYSLVEERVHPDSAANGSSISELALPHNCVILAVLRADEVVAAHGALTFEPGDEVLAMVHAGAESALHNLLRAPS